MTGSRTTNGAHIDDGELIRWLDGECSDEEKERLSAHIDGCRECRSNADSLAQASALFSKSLVELETHTPGRPERVPTIGARLNSERPRFTLLSPRVLRTAAVLALTVIVFTATPARAWLVQGWEAFRSLVVSDGAEQPVAPVAPEESTIGASSVLRFTPQRSAFRLEFQEWQDAGVLVLLVDSTTSASAAIIGAESDTELILLPSGLRVRNSAGSLDSYEVRLPLSLSSVEVTVAAVTVLRLDIGYQSAPFSREVALSR